MQMFSQGFLDQGTETRPPPQHIVRASILIWPQTTPSPYNGAGRSGRPGASIKEDCHARYTGDSPARSPQGPAAGAAACSPAGTIAGLRCAAAGVDRRGDLRGGVAGVSGWARLGDVSA